MTILPRRNRGLGLPPVQPLAPSGLPAPLATASQDQLRERRRKRLRVHYTGKNYVQSAEVRAVCGQVAVDISRVPNPLPMRRDIEAVADAAHELLSAAVGLIAADRNQSNEARARTRQAAADLAVRPAAPAISDNQIISGSWVHALVDWLAPYDGDLSALLSRALPPDAPSLKGSPSASERIERALRTLDQAVLELERRTVKAAKRQALPSLQEFNDELRVKADAERRERALAKLRVPT
ncbi:hypothetical protein M1247_07120 [Mycobacterium sp. 21AC1]|uniref:hypothetical protein n=1 Tax=[Mycobacterium] appelbergii TaxID=2939269 RepID=UPI002938F12A|nr:hypothetical protein [Mycobacterium sp. 21AC1]MDV3124679.1 hypothetical protein [Mycobacterium sp. 21AC1]